MQYIINGKVVDNITAMEWLRNNPDSFILYNNKPIKYDNEYFISYIYGLQWKYITIYYKRLPSNIYEERISSFCDEKQWCPIQ